MDEVDELIQKLEDTETIAGTKRNTIRRLGELKEPKAVPILLDLLQDKKPLIKWEAILALGEIGDDSAVGPLLCLLEASDPEVRWTSAMALVKIGDERANEPVLGLMKDGDKDVRWRVAEVLGYLADPRAIRPLIDALREDEWSVKIAAAKSLGMLAHQIDGIDLEEIRQTLQRVGSRGGWGVTAYSYIAKGVAKRKKENMPGELLPARIKPPKKGIYRTRRVANG